MVSLNIRGEVDWDLSEVSQGGEFARNLELELDFLNILLLTGLMARFIGEGDLRDGASSLID